MLDRRHSKRTLRIPVRKCQCLLPASPTSTQLAPVTCVATPTAPRDPPPITGQPRGRDVVAVAVVPTEGMPDLLQTHSSLRELQCQIWSVLVTRFERTCGYRPEKQGPSRPAFQGHSRSSELTRIDRVPTTSYIMFHSNYEPTLCHFQDIARYLPKIANFSEPTFI